MLTVTVPLGMGITVCIALILVKYLSAVDIEKAKRTWWKYEMIRMYNEIYQYGGMTRSEYLKKIKELEEDG